MKKLLVICLMSSALVACGDSDKTENNAVDNQFRNLRTVIGQDLDNSNAPAVSVAIYQDGEVVFAEAFGEKVKGSTVTVTPDTLFQSGSTTKMFTGLATLQMVELGMLNIEDKLVNILPDIQYPSVQALTWQEVNIEHLLTHQSGFKDSYSGAEADTGLLDYMVSSYPNLNPQMNPAGIFHNYSNPNWSYLGAIVENLSGEPYVHYMQKNVFSALGMQRTTMDRAKVIEDGDYALGFAVKGQEQYALQNIDQIEREIIAIPAGIETWSTPTEQLKMAEFLLNGNNDILSDQWRTEITKAKINTEVAGLPNNYGYGIYVQDGFTDTDDRYFNTEVWQHGGNTSAYTSLFYILPEKNIAVSIMSSGGYTNFDRSLLAAIEAVTDLPAAQPQPTDEIDSSLYAEYEGVYRNDDLTIRVSTSEQNLQMAIDEFDVEDIPYDTRLTPMGGNSFLAVIGEEAHQVTFLPATVDGETVYFRTRFAVAIKDGF